MRLVSRSQAGFTMVEMILASAIFSMALVGILGTIVQLFTIYQSGNAIRSTQQNARYLTNELNRDIHDLGIAVVPTQTRMCLYSATQRTETGDAVGVMYAQTDTAGNLITSGISGGAAIRAQVRRMPIAGNSASCAAPASMASATVLTTSDVSAIAFKLTASPTTGTTKAVYYQVSVAANSALDLVDPATDPAFGCRQEKGKQYCSVTNLSSLTALGTSGVIQ